MRRSSTVSDSRKLACGAAVGHDQNDCQTRFHPKFTATNLRMSAIEFHSKCGKCSEPATHVVDIWHLAFDDRRLDILHGVSAVYTYTYLILSKFAHKSLTIWKIYVRFDRIRDSQFHFINISSNQQRAKDKMNIVEFNRIIPVC